MAEWRDLARTSRSAARELQRKHLYRSATSRAYYAAFSALTSEIRKHTHDFPKGRTHPPHQGLSAYIKRHLVALPKQRRDELRDAVKRLYKARCDADYVPASVLDETKLRDAMRDMGTVFFELGAT